MKPVEAGDFKTIFEAIPGALLVISPRYTIIAANNAYLETCYTEREAIEGRYIEEVWQNTFNDNAGDNTSTLKSCLQIAITSKKRQEIAIKIVAASNADGPKPEKHWRLSFIPILNDQQTLLYILQHITDITESQKEIETLKKTEHEFQLLVNNVNEYAIFIIDTEGNIATWNSGAEHIKG